MKYEFDLVITGSGTITSIDMYDTTFSYFVLTRFRNVTF